MRLTVGPLPPAVYWRRRAIVLGAALVVLFVVAQTCMSGSPADDDRAGGSDPSPSPSPSAPATTPPPDGNQPAGAPGSSSPPAGPASSDPVGASAPPAGDTCTDDEIKLTALATKTTFAVDAGVRFTIRIAHDADRPCYRDVGGGERELYLVPEPGSGRVWSSRDCADPSGQEVVRLTSGWGPREHHIDFLGNGGPTCTTRLEPGTYKLYARLGTAKSKGVEITLR